MKRGKNWKINKCIINFIYLNISHIGNINYGHYYSYVKIGEIWYEFNDSIVKATSSMDFNSSSVCVLFYEKI